MKLPQKTDKDLRASLEDRAQPKVETRTDVTVSKAPDIKTLGDGQMVVNSGSGYIRSRTKMNRMLMVDTASVTKVTDATTTATTSELSSKLNEIITALNTIGAIE